MCKKLFMVIALVAHVGLFAGFLDDLIGKDKSFLEAHGFKCTDFSCISKDKNISILSFLTIPSIMLKFIAPIKTKSIKRFYLYQNSKLKNKELDDAFHKALVKINEKSKLNYEISKISDKFGDEALVTMTDVKRVGAYVNTLKDTYIESMKQFSEENAQK